MTNQSLTDVAAAVSSASLAAVMAGPQSSTQPGGAIAALRASDSANQVSSVDDADLAFGQIVIAQVLAEQMTSHTPGSYGTGPGASQVAPSPMPTATAVTTAVPTPTPTKRTCERGRRGEHHEAQVTGPARLARRRGRCCTALVGAAAARAAYAAAKARPPGGEKTWTRTNHRGEPVTLLEGPAVAAGMVAAAAVAPGVPARARAAAVLAGAGAAAFGGYDDLAGSGDRRGFRGHLGALREGQLTTGAVKFGGIGATGIGAAATLGGSPADVAINAGLVAGGANLLNLFDLRPGRAIKVALLAAALLRVPVARAGRSWHAARPAWHRGRGSRAAPPGCSARTSASVPCSAMPAPTRSAPCSAPRQRRACRAARGSRHSPRSPASPRQARSSALPR